MREREEEEEEKEDLLTANKERQKVGKHNALSGGVGAQEKEEKQGGGINCGAGA